ncbi:hypothetical protein P8Q88_04865 [Qipengyuania sp. XHP0207]|uniref:hypothetical protein n=1 Tax=Qipengyuania sp. XHP0207 TaxID=3038078 RepID=UPI00241FAA78|nr:hypothetical protein [Qipengyuania sp. XHP0207]MDG5747505.1 hypothetical protein [Qipengyuania sp. XHP0207]
MPDAARSADIAAARRAVADGDAVLAHVGPILEHLVATPDHSLFSDELVARIKGMCHHMAGQVLRAQAEATGEAGREAFAEKHGDALAAAFYRNPHILSHCHTLAMEWQLASRMEAQYGLDPALSPLLQDLIASEDSGVASAAMATLAAQARFAQTQRRMELPVSELPGDLFHEVLLAWRAHAGDRRSDAMIRAETKLRNAYDEASARLSLLARLVSGMGNEQAGALDLERSGVALFVTALAVRSSQSRDLAILSTHEGQSSRLALGLRAAGLTSEEVNAEVLRLHPNREVPVTIGRLSVADARTILAESRSSGIE